MYSVLVCYLGCYYMQSVAIMLIRNRLHAILHHPTIMDPVMDPELVRQGDPTGNSNPQGPCYMCTHNNVYWYHKYGAPGSTLVYNMIFGILHKVLHAEQVYKSCPNDILPAYTKVSIPTVDKQLQHLLSSSYQYTLPPNVADSKSELLLQLYHHQSLHKFAPHSHCSLHTSEEIAGTILKHKNFIMTAAWYYISMGIGYQWIYSIAIPDLEQ